MHLYEYFSTHKKAKDFCLFLCLNFIAMLIQVFSRIGLDILLKPMRHMVEIWPFGAQALGSLIAFLAANIIGKTVSYSLNRKRNFKAKNSFKGLVIYYTMIVIIIIMETVEGTPIRNFLYLKMGGLYEGVHLMTDTVSNHSLYQLCGVLAQWICGTIDSFIIYFMDKYVIMRCK